MLRKNQYVGKKIAFCDCEFRDNCPYLVLNFIDNDEECVICGNFEKFQSVYFKEKYLAFKPLQQFDALEQYEAKLWYNKHFTRETIIVDFDKVQNHIVVLHTNQQGLFYVTNVRYINNKFVFSDEKEYSDMRKAKNYYSWLKLE